MSSQPELYARVMGNLAQAASELLSGDLATGAGKKPSTTSGINFGELHKRMGQAIGAA